MWWLVNVSLFSLINILNLGVAIIGINYFNPNFESGYLIGKEQLYDTLVFKVGLLSHASSAPVSLLLFSYLVLFKKKTSMQLHKIIGKTALIIAFFIVFPSGMILSYYAMGGPIGKFIFFSLSAFMGFSIISAYKSVIVKQFILHEYWMKNSLLLLCSALFLRVLLFTFQSISWHGENMYITAAILSWVPSVVILKIKFSKQLNKMND